MSESLELSPLEASKKLRDAVSAVLLDVREPEEYRAAHLEPSQLIPMNTVPAQLQSIEALADEKDLLILCHHGVRSLQVTAWLRDKGVENCWSVAGGIDRWSIEIDPNIPRY